MSFGTLLVVAAAIVGAHGATPDEAFAGRQASTSLQATRCLNTSVSNETIGLAGASSHAGTRSALHIVAGPLTPPGTIPVSYRVSPTVNDTTSTKIADDKTTSYNKTNQMTRSANPNPPPLHPIGGCRVDTSAGTTAENTEAEDKNNNKTTAQPCVRPGEPAKNHVVGGALLAPARVTPAVLGVDTTQDAVETPGSPPSPPVIDTKSIADTGAAVATGGRPPGVSPDIMTPVRPPWTRTTRALLRHLRNYHEVPPPGDLVTTNNTAKNVGQGGSTLLSSSARDDVGKEDEVSLGRTHAL